MAPHAAKLNSTSLSRLMRVHSALGERPRRLICEPRWHRGYYRSTHNRMIKWVIWFEISGTFKLGMNQKYISRWNSLKRRRSCENRELNALPRATFQASLIWFRGGGDKLAREPSRSGHRLTIKYHPPAHQNGDSAAGIGACFQANILTRASRVSAEFNGRVRSSLRSEIPARPDRKINRSRGRFCSPLATFTAMPRKRGLWAFWRCYKARIDPRAIHFNKSHEIITANLNSRLFQQNQLLSNNLANKNMERKHWNAL